MAPPRLASYFYDAEWATLAAKWSFSQFYTYFSSTLFKKSNQSVSGLSDVTQLLGLTLNTAYVLRSLIAKASNFIYVM